MSEIKTEYTKEMVCPYCGKVNGNSWDYDEENDTRECGSCGEEFNYQRHIDIDYSTWKKDTVNPNLH